MILAGTGHRPKDLGLSYDLNCPKSSWLAAQIHRILEEECPEKIISGMALGFDTLFALVALELEIPVIAAIPCLKQESIWPKKSQELYHEILRNPLVTSVFVTEQEYTKDCMQKRNIWMIDNADKILACHYPKKTFGGTWNAIRYAERHDRQIIRIDPNLWEKEIRKQTV